MNFDASLFAFISAVQLQCKTPIARGRVASTEWKEGANDSAGLCRRMLELLHQFESTSVATAATRSGGLHRRFFTGATTFGVCGKGADESNDSAHRGQYEGPTTAEALVERVAADQKKEQTTVHSDVVRTGDMRSRVGHVQYPLQKVCVVRTQKCTARRCQLDFAKRKTCQRSEPVCACAASMGRWHAFTRNIRHGSHGQKIVKMSDRWLLPCQKSKRHVPQTLPEGNILEGVF